MTRDRANDFGAQPRAARKSTFQVSRRHGAPLVGCSGLLGRRALAYNDHMSDRAQTLLREALTLSLEERANVAAELLASLDDASIEDPAAVQAAWATEIERRARRVLTGESVGEPWEDVRERIVQRLTKR